MFHHLTNTVRDFAPTCQHKKGGTWTQQRTAKTPFPRGQVQAQMRY